MKTATEQLIEQAERLNPTGVIGDGTVAHFHELAARARVEQQQWSTRSVGIYTQKFGRARRP